MLKHRLLSPTPRASDSVGLEWALRMCISNKLPGYADAASLGITLRELLLEGNHVLLYHVYWATVTDALGQITSFIQLDVF